MQSFHINLQPPEYVYVGSYPLKDFKSSQQD